MMAVIIADLQVNPRIIAATKRAGLKDSTTVISLSGAELERLTGLSHNDITQLKDAVSKAVLKNQAITVLDMWKQHCAEKTQVGRLSTGCKQLNQALRGGLLTNGLTEIVGESASGKTQLCLQLCLCVQLPFEHGGLNGGAVYICTEGAFPNKRLEQMARHFTQRHSGVARQRFTDRILLEHVADLEGLDQCLQRRIPLALARRQIRLVIVDSVAALFRCHYDNHNLVERAQHLASVATRLRQLSQQYNAVVVCVNQVSANISKSSNSGGQQKEFVPAMGLVWADFVTCRLMMTRRSDSHTPLDTLTENRQEGGIVINEKIEAVSWKNLEVVFAPHLPPVVIPLVISQQGVSADL